MSGPILLVFRIMLTASLYVFLGWALYILWRDLKQQSIFIAARKTPPLTITIETDHAAPVIRYFEQGEITIGRDPDCECCIADEAISARHARLTFHHSQWWLEDLQSKNGTRLNDEKLTVATVIISGDKIGCAHTTLTVSLGNESLLSPTAQL
jgi:pSer/pThr/pTyr-binding forkhead associated (FHA) protein